MFQRLYLEEGMMINLRNVTLEKGKLIKLKPHQTEFVMNSNPRAILENNLRNYVCVTKGDTITVQFNKKKYLLDVVECKPKDAISLTNVDVEVDFDRPLDYKEESEQKFTKQNSVKIDGEKKLTEDEIKNKIQDEKFKGNCFRMDGKKITENQLKSFEKDKLQKTEDESYDPRKNRLKHGIVFIF
jgi:ubiquitin fusion degradation protein 1